MCLIPLKKIVVSLLYENGFKKHFLFSNRSAINLKEAIKLLKKPNLNSDDVVQCYNLEPNPGLWYMCAYNVLLRALNGNQQALVHWLMKKIPLYWPNTFHPKKWIKVYIDYWKKNVYDAALVNYSNLNPTVEKLKITHVSQKKSIKNTMKSRLKLMKKDSNFVSNELIEHELAEKHVR